MKRLVAFLLPLLITWQAQGQGRNSVWVFGDSAGIDFSNLANPVPIATGMDGRGSCVSISDSTGNLLFYAFSRAISSHITTRVYNKNHQLMQNGDSIIGAAWYNELVFINYPNSDSLFILFTIGGIASVTNEGLFYSIINANGDNGAGEVIAKNINLLSFRMVDCLSAIKHGNGRDWWILFRKYTSFPQGLDEWHKYIVTQSGISNYSIQNIGAYNRTNEGDVTFSDDGKKIGYVNLRGLVELYDFDRCTGLLYNHTVIEPDTQMVDDQYFSCAFSPDASKLYTSTLRDSSGLAYLFQFDLNTSIKDTIWTAGIPVGFGILRRAPDEKIYFSSAYDNGFTWNYPYPDSMRNYINENLSVINHPDSIGSACDFQPFSFNLGGKRTYWGLPNNPDYDLGPLVGSPCDTLTGITNSQQPAGNSELHLSWVPQWEKLFVNAQHLKGRNCLLQIFDMNGKAVFSLRKQTAPPYFTHDIHLPGLAAGMYVVRLGTEKEQLCGKFVVE